MTPFEPQQNGLSRREVVFNAIRDHATGDLIAYDDLPYGRDSDRTAVSKLMEREQGRHIVCVKGEGWRIVTGTDHVAAAQRTRRQATRRMGRAVQIAQTVDRRELSAEEQARADAELITATRSYGALRSLAVRRLGIADILAWRERQEKAA